MPKPPRRMEAQAQNINERLSLILTPHATSKQDIEARSPQSPQNLKQRSPQTTQSNNLVPLSKFGQRSRLTEQLSKSGGLS
jgi:hypothetical protein